MQVVDVTEYYSERGGGIRTYLTDRARFLGRQHRHMVIAPGPRDESSPAAVPRGPARSGSRLVRLGGPALPYDRTYHLLYRLDTVRRWVHSTRPDVLEAHSPYLATAAVLACGRRAARVVTAFWHTDHVGVHLEARLARCFGGRLVRRFGGAVRRGTAALFAPFDAIFVAGRQQAARLRAAGVQRVVYAPFGVDKQIFRPDARRSEVRRAWLAGEPPEAALLVGVGRLAGEKRWDVVLDAFARVRARRPAVLVLFGDGPERGNLERAAPAGVKFAGFEQDRSKLAAALASADLLVHAAPHETFGLGLAEAVACGLPIVVPDAGAAPERVSTMSGGIYRSLDPVACAAAIEAMLARSPAELRAHALDAASAARPAEQHFAFVVDAYEALLRELRR